MTATTSDRYLETYLPETLVSRLADRSGKSDIWSEWLEGSLMHCDVSGFTPMSERLAEIGKEGAELVAGVLNRFFERMLGITESWGGSCLKFGGDAMLVYFAPTNDAACAAACGLEMQAAMREFRRIEVAGQSYRLRIRIGVHTGRFLTASVGEPDSLLHYFVTGSAVNRVAQVEMEGTPGHVVVSEETAERL